MKLAVLVAIFSVSAFAHARPYTKNMSCEAAADLVAANGAIVMNYGYSARAGWLYKRYVANGHYCGSGETTRPAWVETNNSASCFIGYTCEQHDRN